MPFKLCYIKEINVGSLVLHSTLASLQAPYQKSVAKVVDTLTQTIGELRHCKDLITKSKIDAVGYFDPVTKKVVQDRIQSKARIKYIACDKDGHLDRESREKLC